MQALYPGGTTVAEADAWTPYVEAVRTPPPGRPWVMANMVAGLDGSAAVEGRVGALSSPTDKDLFRTLRALADVVLVGAGTVRAEGYGPVRLDDARRPARRRAGRRGVPALAVLSASLDLDWSSPAFAAGEGSTRPLVLTTAGSDPTRRAAAAVAADVVVVGDERVDLDAALAALRARGAGVVLTEGGPALLGQLVAAGLVDELCLTLAPVLGGDPLPIVAPEARPALARFVLASVLEHDSHLFLRYLREGLA